MFDIFLTLANTPLPTIFVIVGIVSLFFAIGGTIQGYIVIPPNSKKIFASFGTVFLLFGIFLYILPTLSTQSTKPKESKPAIPDSAVIVQQEPVNISASQYWYDTGITVQKGDWLELTAKGSWWSGIRTTGPDGAGGLFRPACGGCPIADGNLGELIGKIDEGAPFRIGSSAIYAVNQDGNLILAMNENAGPCKEGQEGSCYEDNNGVLEVIVTVRRIK